MSINLFSERSLAALYSICTIAVRAMYKEMVLTKQGRFLRGY